VAGNVFDQFDAPAGNVFDQFDAPPAAPPPEETAGRIGGLAGRALATGAGSLFGQAANAMSPIVKLEGALVPDQQTPGQPYSPKLSDMVHPEHYEDFIDWIGDKLGAPKPETGAERIGYKAVQALPSALAAPEAPIAAALAAAAGGAASQGVKELGGGPVAQTLAGLAAGSVPAFAAGVAGAARGTAARGAGATQAAIDDAATTGVNLTAGQATGSRVLQWAEKTAGVLPGGSGVLEKSAAAQRNGLSDKLDDIVSNLSDGESATAENAGGAVQAGAKNAIAQLRADANTAYGAVDSLVPANTGLDVSKTTALLKQLTTPTPGAEATTGALISPKLKELAENLQTDVKNGGGTLPYSAARAAKSALGEQIDWSPFPTDPANGQLKQVYNALRADINTGASQVSPEAAQAVTAADAQYQAGRAKLSALQRIIGSDDKAPEAVFNAALNGTGKNGGATIVNRALGAMDPDQKKLFAAAVLKRMGEASPGQQGAEGGAFNADQFLTNWNKMNANSKSAIFDSLPGEYRQNLDAFARTVDRIKQSGRVLANPSGTAKAVLGGTLLSDLISAVPMAFVAPHVAVGQLASGLGTALGANIGARVLTNPTAVRWLAQQAKMPGAVPNVVNQLNNKQ
jgi:hypothetical protein